MKVKDLLAELSKMDKNSEIKLIVEDPEFEYLVDVVAATKNQLVEHTDGPDDGERISYNVIWADMADSLWTINVISEEILLEEEHRQKEVSEFLDNVSNSVRKIVFVTKFYGMTVYNPTRYLHHIAIHSISGSSLTFWDEHEFDIFVANNSFSVYTMPEVNMDQIGKETE